MPVDGRGQDSSMLSSLFSETGLKKKAVIHLNITDKKISQGKHLEIMKPWDGEQTQWFRTLAAHPEDPSRFNSQHSQMFINLSSKGSDALSWPFQVVPMRCAEIHVNKTLLHFQIKMMMLGE